MKRFSSRIIKFSQSKDFVGKLGEASFTLETGGSKANFYYSFRNSKLCSMTYIADKDEPENGILHALCILLKDADISRIKSLSTREVDSFLRDENHIPAIGEEGFPPNLVEQFKNLLLASILEEEISKGMEFSVLHSNSSYVEKIGAISDFFTLKVNMSAYFVEERIEIELIQLEEKAFYVSFYSSINGVKMAPNSLSMELLSSIERLVRSVIQSENINLVAE